MNEQGLFNLTGRRVAITGGAGHIGRALADVFERMGALVAQVDLPRSETVARVSEERVFLPCDLEDETQRERLIHSLGNDFGGLDILVNNAAMVGTDDLNGWVANFEDQSLTAWRKALEINLTSVFDLCKGCAPLLADGRGGSIVNIGSIYGFLGPNWSLYEGTDMANPAAYAASKGGLIQLTRWLSTTLAPRIRANAVSPGGVFRGQPATFVTRYEKLTPMGRMASETDIVGAVLYFASDLSSYVTGQHLAVDGGWSAW